MTTRKMGLVLVLDGPKTWPLHIRELLTAPESVEALSAHTFMDDAVGVPQVSRAIDEVEKYARAVGVAGFHCTKQAFDLSFTDSGLRILDMKTHHAEFIEKVGQDSLLDESEIREVENALQRWREGHAGRRQGLLWFCLCQRLALDPGTSDFFRYFGGEAIARAFGEHDPLRDWLTTIGEPVVVEVRLDPSDLVLYRDRQLGRSLVSHFATLVNRDFYPEYAEGHVRNDIPPRAVVAVHSREAFVNRVATDNGVMAI